MKTNFLEKNKGIVKYIKKEMEKKHQVELCFGVFRNQLIKFGLKKMIFDNSIYELNDIIKEFLLYKGEKYPTLPKHSWYFETLFLENEDLDYEMDRFLEKYNNEKFIFTVELDEKTNQLMLTLEYKEKIQYKNLITLNLTEFIEDEDEKFEFLKFEDITNFSKREMDLLISLLYDSNVVNSLCIKIADEIKKAEINIQNKLEEVFEEYSIKKES